MKKTVSIIITVLVLILAVLVYWRLHRIYEDRVNHSIRMKLEKQFDTAIQTKTIPKNTDMIGEIKIPSLSINYVILNKTTDKNLAISITKLAGPAINQKGNLVLAGHDMKNGDFFGKLKGIKISDKIIIEDLAGHKKTYHVIKKYSVKDTDTAPLNQDTKGQTLLTLLTCTYLPSDRLVVLAK
ncbi:sortase [Pullulanibacillus sp. KACC 23026]|uniref:sortase n=1 Tax=Pullulanibacillus sp. KACC 23026 TaxID=3028315 RepID=UPI0023B18696|nr:sortase [Pullulanibacillus sp. KACC 23026]WEG13457.1 sortase [Pullulanibacillus sp. KACC 23026]